MRSASGRAPRRAAWRGAVLFAIVLGACSREEPAIPVGRSDSDLVIVTRQLETAFVATTVRSAAQSKKDDRATGWDYRFEEALDPARDGVVSRRFRATVTNRSEKTRTVRLDIDYLAADSREPLKRKTLRTVVVPPFTEIAVSGFTRLRASRDVVAELRATETEPEE